MGKAQKQKSLRRHNPMRVPDSHLPKGLASASETSSKSQQILPILQKIESTEASERKWACVAVSNIIQNDPSTRRLLQGKNVVGVLIARLVDTEDEVIVEAAGALRNLCIDGGFDICAEMYNKNILTPLKACVPKISTTLSQFLAEPKAAAENVRKTVYQLADNVITILWCLSETSNKALNAINDMQLVPFLMSFLAAREKLSLPPVTAAAQCLYVLTDDNMPATTEVRADAGYISCLLSIAQASEGAHPTPQAAQSAKTIQVLASGILKNISPIPPPSAASFIDMNREVILPLLQPIVSSISLVDVTNSVQDLVTRQASEPQIEKLSIKHAPQSDHKTSTELELELLENQLRTVQLSLEILTGICATLPDPSGLEAPGKDDEEEEDDVEIDDELDRDEDMDADDEPASAPREAAPGFLNTLVQPLLALIQPTSLSFPPLAAPSPHPPTTSALSAVHICALECLNNIFLSIATAPSPAIVADHESGIQVWNSVWNALGLVGTQTTGLGQERRQQFWDVGVGVLWGVGRIWRGVIPPNAEQVSLLSQLCTTTADTRLRIKCIGALESLACNQQFVDGNKVIADYLLSLLPQGPATPPAPGTTEPIIQAASALIDIFSDEESAYDINFRQGGYLARLVSSVDGIRKAVKGIDRKKEGDLRMRGEEVRDNLIAFIKYRRSLRL